MLMNASPMKELFYYVTPCCSFPERQTAMVHVTDIGVPSEQHACDWIGQKIVHVSTNMPVCDSEVL